MSYAALKTDLVEDYLVRLDTMGMHLSVEGRVPLLDPRLARWASNLHRRWMDLLALSRFGMVQDAIGDSSIRRPSAQTQEQKVNGYEQKTLLRRAVTRILPDYITVRPKQGFCPPVASWATRLMERKVGRAP